ncbi:quinone oxidoreductase family protein [Curtobacterium sp. Leaf261]|uniref:quinone oxidoreductase family protein n=1 Tax=Curtobacterium sp. Leaf261 TaxID=1736311 RepID=UPI0006F484A0|nr:NADP-dependent oxidoreductase [Curtobacterium sp. Leaf261]KQO62207.1 alcohol dehydrogenase [Curtobacterium sp. Leaf261]
MAMHWIAPRFGGSEVFEYVETDVPAPAPGEVTIAVRAAGMNPADSKHTTAAAGDDPSRLPIAIGYEVAGVLTAIGAAPGDDAASGGAASEGAASEGAASGGAASDAGARTEIASGGGAVGDEVIAFRVSGGYATEITVPAADVFAKPPTLTFPEAANLFLAGSTAADMLRVTGVGEGDRVLVHGASGAVGVSVLQQAARLGARVIGTASAANGDVVRRFGGEPVVYGDDLADRVRAMTGGGGVDAAFDCVGTDEAMDVSLELVADRGRIVTIANASRGRREGVRTVAGNDPESARFRDSVRQRLVDLAAAGELVVPVARTFPLSEARAALELLESGHPGGKLALEP